jgi:serine protease Do
MNIKNVLSTVVISALTTIGVIWGYTRFIREDNPNFQYQTANIPSNYKQAGFFDGEGGTPGPADFTAAAVAATPTVVHIKTKTKARTLSNNLPDSRRNPFSDFFGDDDVFDQLFGQRQRMIPPQQASGSGVIISEDGYIVTNNHVVAGADEVNVTLSNRRSYKAQVVGADPAYDLAVIKISETKLPFMLYGNSDDLRIGQWVLAIGYPLNLEATVTAGIISAKARSLGLNKDRTGNRSYAVESYIQTDAAVNQGNSGGALINTNGQLIGINSAIASPTGFYSGYSYAIPVNIVRKVVNDLIKYGNVQRGFLGAKFVDASLASEAEKKSEGLPADADGIYITEVVTNGGAAAAGIKKGDRIVKINNALVTTGAEMQEQLSRFKPGDKVQVVYMRGGKEYTVDVTLRNNAGNYDIVKADALMDKLGAELATLDAKTARELGISGGVIVKKINDGAINNQTRMRDGFIITRANGKEVKSVDDLRAAIGTTKESKVEGIYPGYDALYEYPLT